MRAAGVLLMLTAGAAPALALAQTAPAPVPPGYVAFGAPPPPGTAPRLKAEVFTPGKTYKVTLRAGDEAMSGLLRFAAARPMAHAQLSGVGGVRSAVLAWYDPVVKAFKRIEVNEKCEISSVTGTLVTDAKGKANVHLHLVLTRSDGSSVSGHLISAVVDPILEVFVTDLGVGQDVPIP